MFTKKSSPAPANPVSETAKKKTSFRLSEEAVNRLIIGVALLSVAGSLFIGWQSLQATPIVSIAQPASSLANSAIYSVPVLKLNNPHQRQGAEIQVDPNNIGRTNPFTKH